MGLFSKVFGGDEKIVIVDLTKPYRDLLSSQTDPIIRGVLLRAIKLRDELQSPDEATHTLLGKEVSDEMTRKLVEAQKQEKTRTPKEIALAAIELAAGHII